MTALGMIGHDTEIALAAGAERAGVVDQNGDGRAKRPGDEFLPEVEGPSLAITTNLSKKAKEGTIEVARRPRRRFGLEELHLAPGLELKDGKKKYPTPCNIHHPVAT